MEFTTKTNSAWKNIPNTDLVLFIDSFDQKNFDVRIGTLTKSQFISQIHAENDIDLNTQLDKIIENHLSSKSLAKLTDEICVLYKKLKDIFSNLPHF